MIALGLTGSIGMGKSTTAQMFRDLGYAVFDADAAVHSLYDVGGRAVPLIRAVFPDCIINGRVDRAKLSNVLQADPLNFEVLTSFIHPWVAELRAEFVKAAQKRGDTIIIFDIPLLFETGGDKHVSKTIVVTAPYAVQRARVLSRPDMNEEKFQALLARQMPDADKRERADYLVYTDKGLDFAREQVQFILDDVRRTLLT